MPAKKTTRVPAATKKTQAASPSESTPQESTQAEPKLPTTGQAELAAETSAGTAEGSSPAGKPVVEKLRRKSDIMQVLRGGAHVLHTEANVYRIVVGDKIHPASKRRIVALIDSGILKPEVGHDRRYILDAAAEAAASEKASAPATEPKVDNE
jgi:hypothetical protein